MVMVMCLKSSLFPAGRTRAALLAAPGRAKAAAGQDCAHQEFAFARLHALGAAQVKLAVMWFSSNQSVDNSVKTMANDTTTPLLP